MDLDANLSEGCWVEEVLLDGRVEELDLLSESLRLLMQLSSLLLHLTDVLCCLL